MMVSMKKDPEDKKDMTQGPEEGMEQEAYPYGLALHLDDDSLEKLDIKKLPVTGSTMTLTAKVRVTGTRADEQADGEVEGSLRLQITDMELKGEKTPPDAGKLYENDSE